jgi:hypothetical protein
MYAFVNLSSSILYTSFYVHSISMLFFPQFVFINFVCIHFTFIQFVCVPLQPNGKMSSDKPRNSHGHLHHQKSYTLPWLHTRESSIRETFPPLNTMEMLRFVLLYLSISIDSNLMYAFL